MDLYGFADYFNSDNKKQELNSETLTLGSNVKKMIPTNHMIFLVKDYLLKTLLKFCATA